MSRLRGVVLLFCLAIQPVSAGWFENSEQTGKRLFEKGEFSQSAQAFKDEYRRGVAFYRAGEYEAAENQFEKVKRSEVQQDARFNLGNSRFQQQNYEGAIRAYLEVLAEEPEHADARYNQGLAKAMLAKTDPAALARLEQEEKEQQQKEKEKEKQEEQKQEQESQSGEQKQEQESQSGEQKQEQESQSGEQKQEQESQSGDQKQEQESQSGDQKQEQESQSGGDDSEQQKAKDSSNGEKGDESDSGEEKTTSEGKAGSEANNEKKGQSGEQREKPESGKEETRDENLDGEGDDREKNREDTGSKIGETETGEGDEAEQEKGKRGDQKESEHKAGEGEKIPDATLPGKQGEKEPGKGEREPRTEMTGHRQQGMLPLPDEIPANQKAEGMEAVEHFEQLGETRDQESEGGSAETGEEGEGTAADAASLLMEQWLHQIEGNPAYLLRQQFGQEEQRLIRLQRGPVSEPRPW